MATTLHRLQVSLPHWMVQFLNERAQAEQVSLAEVIRRLIHREAGRAESTSTDSLWELAGAARETQPLQDGIPVSEAPDLYLATAKLARRSD
jgi:hypothetical protein